MMMQRIANRSTGFLQRGCRLYRTVAYSRPSSSTPSPVQRRPPLQYSSSSTRFSKHFQNQRKSSLAFSNGMNKKGAATKASKATKQHQQSDSSLSWHQVRSIVLSAAVPMVGFGFMDNFIMIQAGSVIDNTIGVQFGLATMTAAALGQIVSDTCGVVFGGTLERVFAIKPIDLTAAQQKLPSIPRLRLAGAVVGVIVGCSIGALVGLWLGVPVDREEEEVVHDRNRSWYRLQKVLEDTMTDHNGDWYARNAACTLYVLDEGEMKHTTTTASSTKNRLKRSLTKSTSFSPAMLLHGLSANDDAAAFQCATDIRSFNLSNKLYIPVMATSSTHDETVLGVLKIEQSPTSQAPSFSNADLDHAKQVARNLGYIMTHMVDK